MLKLRKILLLDYIFYIFTILIIILTIIRLTIKKESNYKITNTEVEGIVTKISYIDEKVSIEIKAKEKLLVTCFVKNKPNIYLGDTIKVVGEFTIPSKNKTKYLFNYKKYLNRKNIFFIIKATSIKKIKSNSNLYYKIKQNIITHLGNNPYLNTFLLGDKSLIKEEVKRSYSENGISHLFAISGMHISLLASIIEKLLKKHFQEDTTYKITTVILLLYLLFVGLSPSILRGVLFYIIFKFNNIYYFYIKPLNIYLFILSISILINPYYIFDIGFLYSYIISFSLIMIKDNLPSNYLFSLLKTSIISLIVSIPISLYNFSSINILSIIYNLFYVPLISIIIFPLSIITSIIPLIEPIYNTLILVLEKSSLILSNINFGKIIFKRLSLIIYIIYFILIVIYILNNNKLILYLFFSILLIHYLVPYFDKSDYIKMIDVGQGDCILIHSNNKNILMDTGGASAYKKSGGIFYNTINPVLKKEGIKKLDYLIISHGDKDHIGEAKTIIYKFKVNNIYINNNKINSLEKEIITSKTKISKEGTIIHLGDFTLIQLNEDMIDENDSSSIYLLKYNNIKVLLTGDASIKSESNLLNKYNLGKIDILKLGHHGSNTSTSNKLLEEIKPDICLISVGENNKFNHPSKEVLERIKDKKIYRTDLNGTITIKFNKKKYTIKADC